MTVCEKAITNSLPKRDICLASWIFAQLDARGILTLILVLILLPKHRSAMPVLSTIMVFTISNLKMKKIPFKIDAQSKNYGIVKLFCDKAWDTGSVSYKLCSLGQIILPLWGSIFLSSSTVSI